MNLRMIWRKNWPDIVAATCGGYPSFVFSSDPADLRDGVPVFCYHTVDPEVIEADLRFLVENGYSTWRADHLVACMRGDSAGFPTDKAVVLTVDDGAANLYSVIYPALKKYGLHAVAFVAPAFHADSYDLDNARRPCTWAELMEMQESGLVDMQAHTYTHRYVPNWPEPLDLAGIDRDYSRSIQTRHMLSMESDFGKAREVLEMRLGKPVHHMAFPMYTGTEAADDIAQAAGYDALWRGTQAGRRANRPGDPIGSIVRIDARFLRRLPGEGRASLSGVLRRQTTSM